MTDKNLPSIEYLRKRLRYEPETGKLFWRDCEEMSRRWNLLWAGKETFTTICRKGYLVGAFDGRHFKAHRVAWALHSDEWPCSQIDHKNGDRKDNRICNLRVVTNLENCRNMAMKINNRSGVTGVYWQKRAKKWRAAIVISRKENHLGFFDTIEEAAKARDAAMKENGFSQRHGLRLIG